MALTETSLNRDLDITSTVSDLCPTGYKFLHQPRENGRGGSVGFINILFM